MLSVMQSQGGLDLLFMIAPFIAIVGMTKSFLGVCLPVAETITALVAGHAGMKKQAKTLAFLAMFIATFGVVDLNPDVITLIETVCGPLTAIFLFLIRRTSFTPAMRCVHCAADGCHGRTGGLLTVSALLYSTF
ncbi:Serine transporter [Cronobacter sakazakii]|nr:Serine transporter [Cronobacter sakazakii]